MDSNIISKIEEIVIRVKEIRDEMITTVEAVHEKLTQKIDKLT